MSGVDVQALYLLLDLALLGFLLVVAGAVVFARNLLTVAILMGVFSLLMAAMYLVLDAPDVAITEAAVGAGMGTVLMLAALLSTGAETKGAACHWVVPLVVVSLVGGMLLYATGEMPFYGDAASPAQVYLKPYYMAQTPAEIGIPSAVASVLASYRGYDTLGETMVVFTAAVGVLLLLDGLRSGKGRT